MSKEISTQQPGLTGLNLYATIDGLASPNVGLRWNGTAFESVQSGHWTTYAIAMTEASGTGSFTADQPAGIPAGTPLAVYVYQRAGATAAPTDPVKGSGQIGGSTPAPGSISMTTFAADWKTLNTRAYFVTTGTTSPVSADVWYTAGIYNNIAYYASTATGLFAWYNTSGFTISTVVGTNGASYWTTAGGATVVGPYTAQGSATGTPAVVAHGNAILNTFEPDVVLPATDASGRVLLQPVVHTGATVPTVTTYTGNTPQTGDNFARIGAAGAGLTAIGDTRLANLDAAVSSRLAPGGTLATVTSVVTTTNLTNLPAVPTDWLAAAGVKADAVAKIQAGLATPTNITAGTITTATNLTNAPTAGDLTAAMKASVTTAATAATPTIAAVSGAVGSISGVTFPANFSAFSIASDGTVRLAGAPKKNTAIAGFQFFMNLAGTSNPATGKSVTATRSLDGGAFAGCANAAVEMANGWYKIDLAAGDLNGTSVALNFAAAGCDAAIFNVLTTA